MREIKFRGKNEDANQWVYGWYTKLTEGLRRFDAIISEVDGKLTRFYIHNSKTIGQLLFRINGHNYFTGDILGRDGSNTKYVILWNEENQCFSVFDRADYKSINESDELTRRNILCNKEHVRARFLENYGFYPIGNIHDNPELLEA